MPNKRSHTSRPVFLVYCRIDRLPSVAKALATLARLDEVEDMIDVTPRKTIVTRVFGCEHCSDLVGTCHVEQFGDDELLK